MQKVISASKHGRTVNDKLARIAASKHSFSAERLIRAHPLWPTQQSATPGWPAFFTGNLVIWVWCNWWSAVLQRTNRTTYATRKADLFYTLHSERRPLMDFAG